MIDYLRVRINLSSREIYLKVFFRQKPLILLVEARKLSLR